MNSLEILALIQALTSVLSQAMAQGREPTDAEVAKALSDMAVSFDVVEEAIAAAKARRAADAAATP